MDYSKAVEKLIARQVRDWRLASRNYAALAAALTRELALNDSATVVLQSNPERRRSSMAVIDKKALARRQCFLCTENQPPRQRALLWGDHYKIQVNPYPVFERHLTIADLTHVPQRLAGRLGDMLRLAKGLPDFVIFYNGPRCGASAPDHAHFQAGCKGMMPLCDELLQATTIMLDDSDEGFIGLVDSLGRCFFTIETTTMRAAERYARRLLGLLPVPTGDDEPMVNVLCWWDQTDHAWRMAIFPRRKHRPACYGMGEGRLLISPASVEMGGLWAVPQQEDFEALTADQVKAIYDEVCMSRNELNKVIANYSQHWEDVESIM